MEEGPQRTTPQLLEPSLIQQYLPHRKKNAQKGDFGHVLIIGGNYGMAGAVRLAAEAALRMGAGLVSVVTRKGHATLICAHYPEIMCHELTNLDELQGLMTRASVIVLGPGLGQDSWAKELHAKMLETELPCVIDADGLNLLGPHPKCKKSWILTPHPGEAARLLGCKSAAEIQNDRIQAIETLSKQGGHWVLKGSDTLIQSSQSSIFLCPFGNPGMASGGMGDALSGVIGALVAQHLSLDVAATLGVLIHALAGDLAAKRGERGLVATDLINEIRTVINF